MPYARRTPRLARMRARTTLQQDGMLFLWNDPEGNPPPPGITIPRIEGATSDDWTDWHWYTTVVGSNCREIIGNVVDMAHFFYVHDSLPTYFKNIFEGNVATQYMNGKGRPDLGGTVGAEMVGTTSVASYYGPSFMIDDPTHHYRTGDAHSILINCHYPIDANSFVLQYSVQWNADATTRCAELAEARKISPHARRAVFLVCSALSESILDAVRRGALSIVDEA